MATKQVIVMRKDLGMRKGKMIAQGAHASLGAVLKLMKVSRYKYELKIDRGSYLDDWFNGTFTKISVYVESEEELLELYKKAFREDIPCSLITDAGLTEFSGTPTKTCIAIGPFRENEINKITGHLPLL